MMRAYIYIAHSMSKQLSLKPEQIIMTEFLIINITVIPVVISVGNF
jgi:hypothetical protein